MTDEAPTAAAQTLFGRAVKPLYRFAKAKRIVSIDADFFQAEAGCIAYARDFAKGRRVTNREDAMNRLYMVESGLSLTGSMADHRLRLASSHMTAFAAALAAKVTGDASLGRLAQGLEIKPEWIAECAADLAAFKGESLVVAGPHLPPAVHSLTYSINAALGNIGNTVDFVEVPEPGPPRSPIAWPPRSAPARSRRSSFSAAIRPTTPRPTSIGPACRAPSAKSSASAGTSTKRPSWRAPAWRRPTTSSPGAMPALPTARSFRSSR